VFSELNARDKARTWGYDRFSLLNAPINGTFTLSCRVFFIRYTLVQTELDIVIPVNQEPV
jgi:Co/Zn/Cd efflux system component